jgi:hypothetical protein
MCGVGGIAKREKFQNASAAAVEKIHTKGCRKKNAKNTNKINALLWQENQ